MSELFPTRNVPAAHTVRMDYRDAARKPRRLCAQWNLMRRQGWHASGKRRFCTIGENDTEPVGVSYFPFMCPDAKVVVRVFERQCAPTRPATLRSLAGSGNLWYTNGRIRAPTAPLGGHRPVGARAILERNSGVAGPKSEMCRVTIRYVALPRSVQRQAAGGPLRFRFKYRHCEINAQEHCVYKAASIKTICFEILMKYTAVKRL